MIAAGPKRHWYTTWFDADPRALGAFRVALGLLGIWDVIRRWPWLELLYTNDGLYPNHFSLFNKGSAYFSLLHSFKTLGEVQLFCLGAIVCLFFFTIGWRTKLFQWLSALAIISIHNRTIIVENGGDVVFNLWWLWTIFLPLGRRYSVDAIRKSMRREVALDSAQLSQPVWRDERVIRHFAVFCVIWQLFLIYIFNAIHKNGGHWTEGTAIAWALHSERLATPLGIWFSQNMPFWVTKSMTFGTLVIEWAAPILLLLPIFVTWCRRIALLALTALHVGIFFLMEVGAFAPVMVVSYLILLTPRDFDLFARWLGRLAGPPIKVYYDSDCGICSWLCRVGRRLDVLGKIEWLGHDVTGRPPTGWTDEQLAAEREHSIIVDDGERVLTKAAGLHRILRALPFMRLFAWPLRIPGISHLVDWLYGAFGQRRHRFSAWLGMGLCGISKPLAPAVEREPGRWAVHFGWIGLILSHAVLFVAFWATQTQVVAENHYMKKHYKGYRQPALARSIVSYGRWFQGWSMFAPNVPNMDGVIVIDAELSDGRRLDPITGQPPKLRMPHPDLDLYDQFWSSISSRMPEKHRASYLRSFGDWLRKPVRRFTFAPDVRIKRFKIWYVTARNVNPRTGYQELTGQDVILQFPTRPWEYDPPLEKLKE